MIDACKFLSEISIFIYFFWIDGGKRAGSGAMAYEMSFLEPIVLSFTSDGAFEVSGPLD